MAGTGVFVLVVFAARAVRSTRLQWKSCKNAPPAIPGVCRQLSNPYLNFSNVDVLLADRNVIVARLATLVTLKVAADKHIFLCILEDITV